MNPQIKFQKMHLDVQTPSYSTPGSAAVDIRAYLNHPHASFIIEPGGQLLVSTGLKVWVEDPAYAAFLLPRSGMGVKGLVLGNLVGLIDSDYQGELKVCLWNRSAVEQSVAHGDRIAQMTILRTQQFDFVEVQEFVATERGEGGFGSTGHG